jgi:hypothetical protein
MSCRILPSLSIGTGNCGRAGMSPVVRPLPFQILAPSLLQQLPAAPIGLQGDPMLLLVVVVVVFPLPNLLENPKPLACLSLLLRPSQLLRLVCLLLRLSLLHCLSLLLRPSQLPCSRRMPSLLRSWLPTVVPAQPVGASTGTLGGGFPAWAPAAARANTGEACSPCDASDDSATLWSCVTSIMLADTPGPAPL